MGAFARGLGVQCSYCHVQEPTDGREDMAADDKAPKNTARIMMKMMTDLNTRLGAAVGKPAAELTRVQCVTCHRGVAILKRLAEILVETDTQKGLPAAIQQWRDLRKQYYTRKNDRTSAIRSFEKVLEIDPQNQNARRQLDQRWRPRPNRRWQHLRSQAPVASARMWPARARRSRRRSGSELSTIDLS